MALKDSMIVPKGFNLDNDRKLPKIYDVGFFVSSCL